MVNFQSKRSLCAVLMLLGLWAGSLQAQVAGLVYDGGLDELRVVSVDSATGDATAGSAAIPGCCGLFSGLVTSDLENQRFFTIGVFNSGPIADQPAILELAFDGESIGATPIVDVPQAVLEYDSANDRLITFDTTDLATGIQVIAIDPVNGTRSTIGSPNTGCCEVATGVSAIDATAQQLYFAGRAGGQVDWSLYSVDLMTGVVVLESPLVSGSPGFMALDDETGFVEVLMQSSLAGSSQIVGVDLINGGILVLAEQVDQNCCLLTVGQTPSLSESADTWWLSGSSTNLESALLALSSASLNGLTRVQPITPGLQLIAVSVDGQTVSLDDVFRDRFQL